MNAIQDAPGRGFSDVLASMQMMAQSGNDQKTREPEKVTPKVISQGTEVLKRQLSVNESFWNMVTAESVKSECGANPQPEEIASASARSAEAAMRLRLVSAYGTATTEAIAGRRDTTAANQAGATMRSSKSSTERSPERVHHQFSLAA